MKEIWNHSKCCMSRFDRLRHELDRGIKARQREERRPEGPRDWVLDGINMHIARFGAELRAEEVKRVEELTKSVPTTQEIEKSTFAIDAQAPAK